MANVQEISAEFPFRSNYVEAHGSRMHYIDEGSGDPILFLHGNPTSSYLWRNIIPYLTPLGRCIAPDLIGMGRSDAPDLAYRFVDHARYAEGFIEKLGLKNITLVIHDWGSALGFHYAMRNENNIKMGKPIDVYEVVSNYNEKLQESELPKLLFFASPGGLINAKTVEWCEQKLKNLEAINIGAGIHYLQEDNPHQIGSTLAKWYTGLS